MRRSLFSAMVVTSALWALACPDSGPKDANYWLKKYIEKPRMREQAISAFKSLRNDGKVDASHLPRLLEALKIEDEGRKDIAFALGEIGDKSVVQPLIQAIDFGVGAGRDKETKAKNQANLKIVEALGKLGDPGGVEPATRLLRSRDQYVQLAAVRTLGELKAAQSVDRLIEIAETNENNFMVKNAIAALGEIGDAKAVPLLIKMMFFERRVSFYREASYALFVVGKPAVPALIDAYRGKNEEINAMKLDPAVVPSKIAVVLGDIGVAEGLPVIREVAEFPDDQSPMGMAPLARVNAIRALGLMGDKNAVELLKKGIFNIDVSQREFPTESLGLIGDRSVCPDLFRAASHEPYWEDCKKEGYADEACKNSEWEVRQLSGEWLTRLCDASYYPMFKEMLDGEKDEKVKKMMEVDLVRLEVAKECGSKADCYVEKLKAMPPEGAPRDEVFRLARVRDKAGFELSYLRDPNAAAALLETLQDPDLEARYAKVIALLRLLPKEGGDRVDEIVKDEHGKATFIKINEDLKRLAVKLHRGY